MLVKWGAKVSELDAHIRAAFPNIIHAYSLVGQEPVITSGNDGTHMQGSLHYRNLAIDLRLPSKYNGLSAADMIVHNKLADLLAPDYDVILEETHIHVEYDPKRKEKNLPTYVSKV